MLCLYSCGTALLTVSAHGRRKATEGGKSNTEALHAYPAVDIRLSFKLTFDHSSPCNKLFAWYCSTWKFANVERDNHQTCYVEEEEGFYKFLPANTADLGNHVQIIMKSRQSTT